MHHSTLPFSMTTAEHPGGAIVASFYGQATVFTADAFQTEIYRLVAMKPKLVVLDLAELQFMSSFAISSFLKLDNDIKIGGGKVRIAAPSQYIQSLLIATRMDSRIEVFPTVEIALQS